MKKPRVKAPKGFVLLLFLGLLIGAGLVGNKLYAKKKQQSNVANQKKTENAIALHQLKRSLLTFAQLQGSNSHSHLGHLVCPALTPDAPPQTTCVQNNIGYFPMESVAKTNYLRNTVPTVWDYTKPTQQKAWGYAVSQQVVQPNTLGWSQWVDFSKPSLTVHLKNQTLTHVVAVIASVIDTNVDGTLSATAPAVWIDQTELEREAHKVRALYLKHTLNRWLAPNTPPSANENLTQISTNSFQPVNSQCACRCTKTQCTCNCMAPAKWRSLFACKTESEQCTKSQQGQTVCESTPEQPCVFKGPAGLASRWPISNYNPAPVRGKPCQPQQIDTCPTSPTSTACECEFNWPTPTISQLPTTTIEWQTNNGQTQVQVKNNAL